ncbi:MAG TPA: PGPGW domain-containing protein [Gammaproteobacteria bacterium]
MKKTLLISAGILLMAVGVIFLAIPGPGLLVILAGAALIAQESLFVSRLFDRVEPHIWRLARWCRIKWQGFSLAIKILLITIAALVAGVALFGTYKIFYQ